jgi:hypothetical protein
MVAGAAGFTGNVDELKLVDTSYLCRTINLSALLLQLKRETIYTWRSLRRVV